MLVPNPACNTMVEEMEHLVEAAKNANVKRYDGPRWLAAVKTRNALLSLRALATVNAVRCT